MAGCRRRDGAADARRPRLRPRRRRAAPRGRAADRGADREYAAQSHRHGAAARGAGRHRRGRRRARPAGHHRRGLRTAGVRRPSRTSRWPPFPGWRERTVTISSAAKMFNCTGWKIGWACGPAELIAGVRAAKQYLSYVGGAPFQPAVAQALDTEDAVGGRAAGVVARQARQTQHRADRNRFRRACQFRHLFPVRRPEAAGLRRQHGVLPGPPGTVGVAAIPLSAFCDTKDRTSRSGITWCASHSASATRPSTRPSGGYSRSVRCADMDGYPRDMVGYGPHPAGSAVARGAPRSPCSSCSTTRRARRTACSTATRHRRRSCPR